MQPTKIEWCDISANPVKGLCPMACPYCAPSRMYIRFKWDQTIRWEPKVLCQITKLKKPKRIFVGSTIELFGPWVNVAWMDAILDCVWNHPQHIFIFLTKLPQELKRYNPWPGNAWMGATATNDWSLITALDGLDHVKAKVRFLSIEPLLGDLGIIQFPRWLDWVIVGAQTGPGAVKPDLRWVVDIEAAAIPHKIPVFFKDNIRRHYPAFCQCEFPK